MAYREWEDEEQKELIQLEIKGNERTKGVNYDE